MIAAKAVHQYTEARKKVNELIGRTSRPAQAALQTIVEHRSRIQTEIIRNWVNEYRALLPDLPLQIRPGIQERLSRAYLHYCNYVFMYRFFYGNEDNILYEKILSFELFYFAEYDLFSEDWSTLPARSGTDDAYLLNINPLAHWLYFRIVKEYFVDPVPHSELRIPVAQVPSWNLAVLDGIRASVMNFFVNYLEGRKPQLQSFREFVEVPDNRILQYVTKRISKRAFEFL